MMEAEPEKPPEAAPEHDPLHHPAREMSLHLLRMLETRLEAAGIVAQAESQRLLSRLQLKLLAAAAVFIAIWGAIVLLAIALPPDLRVPVRDEESLRSSAPIRARLPSRPVFRQ